MENRYKYTDEKKAHLHTLDGKPLIGTSTAMGVIAKNLVWWAAELSAVVCLEAGEKIVGIREEYLAAASSPDKKKMIDALQKKYPIFKEARFAHYNDKNTKAEAGTDMHAELEEYVKMCIEKNEGKPVETEAGGAKAVQLFSKWSVKNVEKFIASEGHCYSEELWLGGITDCVALLKDGSYAIIDFKSSKEAFASQFFQIGGYDVEITENGIFDADGNLIWKLPEGKEFTKHIVIPFGAENPEPVIDESYIRNREAFKHALGLYKIMLSMGAI